jgi:hypothetical protein
MTPSTARSSPATSRCVICGTFLLRFRNKCCRREIHRSSIHPPLDLHRTQGSSRSFVGAAGTKRDNQQPPTQRPLPVTQLLKNGVVAYVIVLNSTAIGAGRRINPCDSAHTLHGCHSVLRAIDSCWLRVTGQRSTGRATITDRGRCGCFCSSSGCQLYRYLSLCRHS